MAEDRGVSGLYCAGCGHLLSKHREYAEGGRNRHGCSLVCTVDGCRFWGDCRLPPKTRQSPMKARRTR